MSQKILHLVRFMTMMVGFHRQHCHAALFGDYLPPWSKKEKLTPMGVCCTQHNKDFDWQQTLSVVVDLHKFSRS
jgi:hypothetical protein